MLKWIVVSMAVSGLWAQEPARYQIRRAAGPVVLDAKLDEKAWQAPPVSPQDFARIGKTGNIQSPDGVI